MEISRWITKDRIVNVSPSLDGENWFASKILSVGENSFCIDPPKVKDAVIVLPVGHPIRVSVPSSEGLVQFTCGVLSGVGKPVERVELELPKEVVHLERRAFPRLPIRLQAQYAEIRGGVGGLTFSPSTCIDISGGGIRMETRRACPRETLLRVKFQIPLGEMEEELILTGRIVRSVPAEGARRSEVGVEFIDITPHQQRALVQFVLDRMNSTEAREQ